ncbi:TPA: helix-turn-helix domain-containing protein [Staphylococcus aureus]|uniref:LexA family transcriptional regulator n=2 Tax=Staphylococcus aureus TaxID=1280 RepID=UPI00085BDB5E|nr:LexA family transcriptional regulator [Staphylococcus aureus]MBZ5313343.1 helix-turn-helix domain-containing protein [Staphylococcus aureus]MBZ5315342.1 helix-turn-helix domain-containing protein [Staphylococcus aureus]MBZ5317866.1 helix-turn-helix domain-containing protein [Staphylococcus aureus]MBZ5321316.1 helix-turn-helix domain-containing protein [Staphylococcus aureus]MBZ5323972.1 helix-turn-helix domain-containing protein [Staphylococcus aureus]
MNSFKDRLKQIMSERKISQSELSRRTGIGRNSISDYLNGKYEAKQDKVFELAKALNVNEAWLMGFDISKNRKIENNDITSIYNKLTPPRQNNVLNYANSQLDEQNSKGDNVVDINSYKQDKTPVNVNGCVSAGVGERLHDETLFTEMVKAPVPPHDLALKVNGDSMEPMFKDGEIIFVEKTHNIKNGQIGIFIIEEEAYVKKVFVEDDRLTLVSLNKEYRDLHFYRNESVRLVGKVIL